MSKIHSHTITFHDRLGCEKNVRLTVAKHKDGMNEIHILNGRNGSCSLAFASALSAAANLALRKGATLNEVASLLSGIRCSKDGLGCKSCMDALAKDINSIESSS